MNLFKNYRLTLKFFQNLKTKFQYEKKYLKKIENKL